VTGAFSKYMPALQKLGKSLMTPIAILPGAALLLRLGAKDLLNIPIMSQAGGAVFANLPLLFAIGVAIGFTEDVGVAGLSGAVGFLVLTTVTGEIAKNLNTSIDVGVFGGIIMGLTAAYLYNRYHKTRLPEFLAFFGGRRFVPILSSLAGLALGLVFGAIWPPVQNGIASFGNWVQGHGAAGAAVYIMLNRALLPFGLHHIINNPVFFLFGSYTNAAGQTVTGEIPRFFAGDPTAGSFLVGFFPVMLLGYPAAALAMIHTARTSQKRLIAGVLLSAALTSLLTGITEPIEFAFTFVAPILYVANILLSGLSAYVCNLLGIKAGFGFSAGFIDYALNYGLSTKPILLLVVSVAFGVLFYGVWRALIQALNLPTPGRFEEEAAQNASATVLSA